MYRSPLHLVLVYKHLFFLDPNWILSPSVVCLLSPTIWGQNCSYCPMKVISHAPLFQCSSVLQLSIGLLTAPIMTGHGGHGAVLEVLRAQQRKTWAQNCTGTEEVENHLNNNNTSTCQTLTRMRICHHHPTVQHTHELA